MKHLGSSFLRESLSHISYARRQAQRRVRHASGLPILSAPRFNADLVRAHNYITRSPPEVSRVNWANCDNCWKVSKRRIRAAESLSHQARADLQRRPQERRIRHWNPPAPIGYAVISTRLPSLSITTAS